MYAHAGIMSLIVRQICGNMTGSGEMEMAFLHTRRFLSSESFRRKFLAYLRWLVHVYIHVNSYHYICMFNALWRAMAVIWCHRGRINFNPPSPLSVLEIAKLKTLTKHQPTNQQNVMVIFKLPSNTIHSHSHSNNNTARPSYGLIFSCFKR